MNYELGLRGHDIADNFSDMCKKASEYNIKKLQFAMAKTISDTDFDKLGYDEQMAQKVAEGLREENLKVSVLGCYINPVDPDEKARNVSLLRFKNFLRYAKKFNALGVGTETGSAGDMKKTYSDENYKQFVNDFMSIADVAESLDVNILIEPVWGLTIHSVEKMKQMIDDVKSDKLNVILDVSNITVLENYGEQDRMITSAFESFGDRIKVIHFKDFCVENGKKRFAKAGTGDLNAKLLFKYVSECKNTPDIILDETPLNFYKESCQNLEKILNNL